LNARLEDAVCARQQLPQLDSCVDVPVRRGKKSVEVIVSIFGRRWFRTKEIELKSGQLTPQPLGKAAPHRGDFSPLVYFD
jgi:hypothetical protein